MVMTAREILGSVIPEIQLDNVTLETTNDGQTRVRVNFCIYDLVDKNEIGTWFEQIEYEQYFRPSIELTYSSTEFDRSDIDELPTMPPEAPEVFPITGINLPKTDYISSDGYRVNKFPFEFVTTLPKDPYYLKVKMTSEFDIDLLEQNEGIDLSFMGVQYGAARYTRKVKSQLLIDERQAKYPFQDFRSRNLINKLEIDETGIIAQFNRRYEEASRILEDNSSRANDFMSDFLLTRNAQGEAKFLFIFDARSFYNKKSEYRRYFSRLTASDQRTVLLRTDINSLKILRKRVKLSSDGLGKPNVINFEDYESRKTLCVTRKPANNPKFTTVSNDTAAIRQIDIEVENAPDLYFITGTDYEVARKNSGAYAYGVSISIVDNLKSILREKLARLESNVSKMRKLYYKMSSPENYDAILNLSKKSLQGIDPTAEDMIAGIISDFKDTCSIFANNFLSIDSEGNPSKFQNLCDSVQQPSPSPEIIEVLFTLMEVLLLKARSDIGEPINSSSLISRKNSDNVIDSEKYYDTPDRIFDASVAKVDGMEYLVDFSENLSQDALEEISSLAYTSGGIGLKTIDAAAFEKRFVSEVERYFSSENVLVSPELNQGGVNTQSQVSVTGTGSEYFTPSAFFNGNGSSPTSVFNVKDHNSLKDAISENIISTGNFDNIAKLAGAPRLLPPRGSKEATFLSQRGAIFYDSEKEVTLIKGDSSSGRVLTEDFSPRRTAAEINRDQESRDFESFVFSKMSKVLSGPKLGTQRTLNNSSGVEDAYAAVNTDPGVELTEYENTPNPFKAFSLIGTGQSALTRFEEQSIVQGTYTVSMSFLMKLEYLSGFEKSSDGENLVMKPIFSSLTLDVYRQNKNRNLLCRLHKYSLDEFGIRKTATNKPVFDSVFVVRPAQVDRVAENRIFEASAAETTAAEVVGATYEAVDDLMNSQIQELRNQREEMLIDANTKAVQVRRLEEKITTKESDIRDIDIRLTTLRRSLLSGSVSGPQATFTRMQIQEFEESRESLVFGISHHQGEIEDFLSEIANLNSQIAEIEGEINRLEEI